MRLLSLLLALCLISACHSTQKMDTENKAKPLPTQHYAPVAMLFQTHYAICSTNALSTTDRQMHTLPIHYQQHQTLNLFFTKWCNSPSTTTQLRLLKILVEQNKWPDEYAIYFNFMKRSTQDLRTQKLANIALKKSLESTEYRLKNLQITLIELKKQLTQVELQRLNPSVPEIPTQLREEGAL
ncbi:hypothetical protein PCIT_b0132 [Pseudoalteromonas citrea]|uniref:Uncharacterized protein n=2 Tax=Pseudoalteromonas citrea TaxID=43655 RepID=A0AAD4ADZ8_9GAMM|nr:hypothetical protein [Pseudoalteromonas citrea]KAF7764201.1 hypothetical protein PCIT_b0132 [Pseudoalteromonas citrea]